MIYFNVISVTGNLHSHSLACQEFVVVL